MNTSKDELMQQISGQLDTVSDFGQMQIYIKKHVGAYSSTDYVKMTNFRYNDNEPNVNMTADIFRLIKQITDARLNGSLSFSVQFKHGRAELMQVQDFKKL